MASSSPWEDMEGSFFICSVCLDNFKEPKQLPCLHRYCRHCLAPIVERHRGKFNCPLCKSVCLIPDGGVDGFKTDFHMKSMLEFITLQKSVQTEESRTCKGCQKMEKVVAYCFKCKGFLCNQWYQFHLNNDIVQDHKNNVLLLQDISEKKLSLKKLASLTEAPRCRVHVEKPAEICCETCGNLPICMVCGHHGKHKAHQIHDVKELAIRERENIQNIVATLDKYKEYVHNMPKRLERARKQLDGNLAIRKGNLQSEYRKKLEKIGEMLREVDGLLEKNKAKIAEEKWRNLKTLEARRAEEIAAAVNEINEKYDKLVDEKEVENDVHREEQEEIFGEKRANLNIKLGFLDKEFKDIDKSIDMQAEQSSEGLAKISGRSESRVGRFDNFMSTVSSILASNDDWTDSQCLPDISTASGPLVEDVKREFSELESLPEITSSELPLIVDKVRIADEAEAVVDINEFDNEARYIQGMTTNKEGRIVISGQASRQLAQVIVVDTKGELIWKNRIETVDKTIKYSLCHCAALSNDEIVISYNFNVIKKYNIRNGNCSGSYYCSGIKNWCVTRKLTCIAIDPVCKDILVGSSSKAGGPSRDVLVLDRKMNFRHTIILPDAISGWARDITFHRGNLVVCDDVGRTASAVSINGHNTELVHQFNKPDSGGFDWHPFRTCTDSKDFIYMLWGAMVGDTPRCIIMQYSQDGLHLLTTKPVDGNASCLTSTFIDGREKLLVTTSKTRIMYIYDLIEENP